MKIKLKTKDFDQVMAMKRPKHQKPMRPSFLLATLIRLLSLPEMLSTRFSFEEIGTEKIKGQPCLILMNHSCFLDLSIANRIFYPRPYSIVCTSDGFVGKNWLMRWLGCIPTQKFVSDLELVQDMIYATKVKKTSVLMFPEASYSFDGTATALPRKMGVLLKKLDVPVVMVKTSGAFSRTPLYNNLRKRKVQVSATVQCLFTREELKTLSVQELDAKLDEAFTFDGFQWQWETGLEIHHKDRAEGLERILYRCANCSTEGKMAGKGTTLTCGHCGKTYTLTPRGKLQAQDGHTEFPHIPQWYNWERQQVRNSLMDGSYRLDVPVKIAMMVDYKAIYMVGEGRLVHDREGFTLTGCNGRLEYRQKPLASYGLYADYYWYEIDDVICIGNKERLYYCFPQEGDVVAKARLATEELYKLTKARRKDTPMAPEA